MAKTVIIATLLILVGNNCFSQKILQKEFSADGIESFIIHDDTIFEINIETADTDKIVIIAHVSGENAESIVVDEKLRDKELSISTGFIPYFEKQNDKLAAHKLLAIEMQIILPQRLMLKIESKLASVTATGNYKNVEISLNEGNCVLKNFIGDALLQTRQGNITVYAQNGVSGTGFSKNATVENTLPSTGKYHIEAESINGTISLLQTE